ncbi:S-type anion channel SLAH1 [Zostera marina]|uniref:S-type anion channel SLAH1 n=1 Tax=Zostera marina TaxID=29655 RepID=A0A0K9NJ73_ZOSMR|nr:S-type anion channel SLAH1 [Zostera marina]
MDEQPSKLSVLTGFHAGYFRITMSLSSQALLWKTLMAYSSSASSISYIPTSIRDIAHHLHSTLFLLFWSISLAVLTSLSLLYLLRCVLRFESVKKEFTHHVGANYLFAPSISWLLLLESSPLDLLEISKLLYVALWLVFSLPAVGLEVKIYGQWFTKGKRFLASVANPTSQISVIANMVVARGAAEMDCKELALWVFSFGFAHYVVLFVTLYQRFNDGKMVPAELSPVFFLFFATPSFASLAWSSLSVDGDGGGNVMGSKMLFFLSLFLFGCLIARPALFKQSMEKFDVAWWAYSFPLSALAMGSVQYARDVRDPFADNLMLVLLVVSVGVTFVLMIYTVLNAGKIIPHGGTDNDVDGDGDVDVYVVQ